MSNYFRNVKYEAYYQHNRVVIQSLEKIKDNYFSDISDKAEFRVFLLKQYTELYKHPLISNKRLFFMKNNLAEVKASLED